MPTESGRAEPDCMGFEILADWQTPHNISLQDYKGR